MVRCIPRKNIVEGVLRKMKKEKVKKDFASPNFVHSFAWHRGYELKQCEVVEISDRYGEKITHSKWMRDKGDLF